MYADHLERAVSEEVIGLLQGTGFAGGSFNGGHFLETL